LQVFGTIIVLTATNIPTIMKKYIASIAVLCLIAFIGCEPEVALDNQTSSGTDTTKTVTPVIDTDTINGAAFTDSLVIVWDGSSASVSGNVENVTVTGNSNGYVVITSTTTSEKYVKYLLSGNGSGQFKLYSAQPYELQLKGLTLTCSNGPAINSQSKKTGYITVSNTNTLTDGSTYATSTEDQKAVLFSEGQLVFSGDGTLNVTGNCKHAIASDDYIRIRGGVLNIQANVSDGIHVNDGLFVDGGNITVNAAGDGLQSDSATIQITAGTINVTSVDKGILSQTGTLSISGGTINVTTSGSEGKGLKSEGAMAISGGKTTVICSTSSGAYAPAWGPGGGGPGGGSSSSGPEGIEGEASITITGGEVYSYSSDDAINAGGDLTISGGLVCAHSTGNDGIDANGNCYIKGGVVYAIGASSPEVAIDANSEEQKKLYLTGGTLVAVGSLESGASLSQTCYQASGSTSTWYALVVGDEVFAFKTPGSNASKIVVSGASQPALYKSVTPSGTAVFNNTAYYPASYSGGSSVSLSTYSASSGGGPGGW